MHVRQIIRVAIMLAGLLAQFMQPVIHRLQARRIAFQRMTGTADRGAGFGKFGISTFKRGLCLIQKTARQRRGLLKGGAGPAKP
mgnify:CR=1 FL=1